MKPGPYKKSAALEVLQGNPGKRGLTGRPTGDFSADLAWFEGWAAHYERKHREEVASGNNQPTPAFWAAFKCRKMVLDIKAKLAVEAPQEKPKSRWQGLLTSS